MTTNQLFLEATDHFYKNQYQQGLQKIRACLQSHPTNPTLLANRALFFSQMGHLQKAIQQLQACIRIDYQNYIPYFNLFSLKVRTNQLEEALKELCCSLSCLYLTRARFRKREQDAREAIKYAKNNVEAHVLRAMMLLQSKKLKDCMNQLEWAYQLQQNNATLNRIRAIVSKKLGISLKPQPSDPVPLASQIQRLHCSYQPQQPDTLMQIKMKMTQFNSIYNDLNQQNGIVTHRVPRTLLPQEIQKLLHSDSQLKQEIQELYELKYNAEDTNEPVIYQMKEEYRVQNQLEFEERLKEDEQDEDPFGGSDHNQLQDDSLIDRIDEQDQREISKIAEHSKQQIDAQNNINEAHNTQSQQPSELSQGSFNQYLVVDQYPQLPQPQQLQQSHSQIHPQQSFSAITEEKSTYTQQHVGESSVSSLGTQEVVQLYPMLKKTYGRFKVDRLGITEERYIKGFLQGENAGEMYCVATYHKEKPGYKVTTCDRQLYFNQFERTVECEWGETFKEVLLINQPAQLMVKIYAKNNNFYNDDLIGVGCHQIKENGDIMVRITKPNGNEGQALGELKVKLFLVQK